MEFAGFHVTKGLAEAAEDPEGSYAQAVLRVDLLDLQDLRELMAEAAIAAGRFADIKKAVHFEDVFRHAYDLLQREVRSIQGE